MNARDSQLVYKSAFDFAGEYFLELKQHLKNHNVNLVKNNDWYTPVNIDERISSSRYFYFPYEDGAKDMFNCFEQNITFYLGLKELYPASNPLLINLALDDVNMHSGVLFTEENQVYYADPVRNIFGPCEIGFDKVKVSKNLVSDLLEEREIAFQNMFKVEHKTLEEIISHLRKPEGIVSFFYGSGQRASAIPEWPYYKELFMHIDDEYMIHGQIRVEDAIPSENNVMIRIKYCPFTGMYDFYNFSYVSSFWQKTQGKKLITSDDEVMTKLNFIAKGVSDYLARTQMSFDFKNLEFERLYLLRHRLETHLKNKDKSPKDFIYAKKLGINFYMYYLGYVFENEGEDFGKVYDLVDNLENILLPEINIELDKETEKKVFEKELDSRYRFQLFRLAYDFKKYAEEIRKII